jgi:hypothetical protein
VSTSAAGEKINFRFTDLRLKNKMMFCYAFGMKNILAKLGKIIALRKIVKVDGGLGSQISQYILGQYIKETCNMPVKYDTSWFDTCGKDCDKKHDRNFDLLKLFPNLDFQKASEREISIYRKYFLYTNKNTFLFNKEITRQRLPQYLDGYYANCMYTYLVRNKIPELFKFSYTASDKKTEKIMTEIKTHPNSVAVHIRRGDFVNLGWCIVHPQYYVFAARYLAEKIFPAEPHFFIFSDDFDYVKENILPRLKVGAFTCVEQNDNDSGYVDFFLMAHCRHKIIANSGFSFNAAVLSPINDGIVIAPEFFYDNGEEGSGDCFRYPGWIFQKNVPPV